MVRPTAEHVPVEREDIWERFQVLPTAHCVGFAAFLALVIDEEVHGILQTDLTE